jgi:hypothetical protein
MDRGNKYIRTELALLELTSVEYNHLFIQSLLVCEPHYTRQESI